MNRCQTLCEHVLRQRGTRAMCLHCLQKNAIQKILHIHHTASFCTGKNTRFALQKTGVLTVIVCACTCSLTLLWDGPWWIRIWTMSTSPLHAARCRGKHPLLSAIFVEASYCNNFNTTSLKERCTKDSFFGHSQMCVSFLKVKNSWLY